MFCALLGQDIRRAFTGPLVLWLYPWYTKYIGFIPPVYKVYRGYIVFAFSVSMFVCKLFFLSNISQKLHDLGF